nr:helix-turn-helix domain-containing protein [Phytohabitans suffuscus]
MDLLWWRGELVVAGPDTVAYESRLDPGETIVGLRFAPGMAPAALGVPADELRDARVPLSALWPASLVRETAERMGTAPERIAVAPGWVGAFPGRIGAAPERVGAAAERVGAVPGRIGAAAERVGAAAERVGAFPGRVGAVPGRIGAAPERIGAAAGRVLEDLAVRRVAAAGGPDRAVRAVVSLLRAGTPVADVAGEVGLSERQLHRRSLTAFGYGPKTLARILRLERALALARAGRPLAEVAAESGYADQAHLSRDARALGGAPMGQLIRP